MKKSEEQRLLFERKLAILVRVREKGQTKRTGAAPRAGSRTNKSAGLPVLLNDYVTAQEGIEIAFKVIAGGMAE